VLRRRQRSDKADVSKAHKGEATSGGATSRAGRPHTGRRPCRGSLLRLAHRGPEGEEVAVGFGLVAPYGTALFEPLLAPGGALAPTVGVVIGTGEGRGIGFMYLLFALIMAVIALVALRWLAGFDDRVPTPSPTTSSASKAPAP
jgi:hypothetical protein